MFAKFKEDVTMVSGGLSIVSPEMLADADRLHVEAMRTELDLKAIERLAKAILNRAKKLRPKASIPRMADPSQVVWKEDDHPLWMGS